MVEAQLPLPKNSSTAKAAVPKDNRRPADKTASPTAPLVFGSHGRGLGNPPSAVNGSPPAQPTLSDTAEDDLVRVSVQSSKVGKVSLTTIVGEKSASENDLLQIQLSITNKTDAKKIDFRGWGAGTFKLTKSASLEDDAGNSYKRIYFGASKIVGQNDNESIYPGKSITEMLVFEVPVKAAKTLTLELPCEAYGEEGSLSIVMPAHSSPPKPTKAVNSPTTVVKELESEPEPKPPSSTKKPDPPSDPEKKWGFALNRAKNLIFAKKIDSAVEQLEKIVTEGKGTKAAEEAAKLLEKYKK